MKKFNPVILPYLGAFVQAVLFAIAGERYFGGWFGRVAGFGVGAVVNLSMAIASSRISDIAQKRKRLAYLALICLFCVSPLVIASSIGWSVATVAWAVAVDLSILLTGSTFGGSLIAKDELRRAPTPAETPAERRSAKSSKSLGGIACRFAGAGCGRKFASQNAANAHARTCGFKPTVSMPIDVTSEMKK